MRAVLGTIMGGMAIAGCASASQGVRAVSKAAPTGADPIAAARAVSAAADQVKGCYRSPKLNRTARQIVTVLRVNYTADGNLATLPQLIKQDGLTIDNQIYASQMVQAAIEAVTRCVPLRLPVELYKGGWDEFELTFSPKGLA